MYAQTTWLAKILNTINGMFPESNFLAIWSNRDEDFSVDMRPLQKCLSSSGQKNARLPRQSLHKKFWEREPRALFFVVNGVVSGGDVRFFDANWIFAHAFKLYRCSVDVVHMVYRFIHVFDT